MTDTPSPPATVLLVVEDRDTRSRLREWFAETEGFDATVADSDDPFGEAFDICVLDIDATARHESALAASRASTPTYLPTLLYVPERYGDADAALDGLGSAAADIDETVSGPIRGAALERRLHVLLRARRLSTDLESSRRRFERLVEFLPDAVFVCRGGTVSYANPMAESLLAVEPSSLSGRPFSDLVSPADRERVEEAIADARERGRGGPVETALTREAAPDTDGGGVVGAATATGRPGGTATGPVPVELTAIDVGEGDVQVVAHDLRDRHEREERLELYRRAMDEATVGITIADHTAADEPLIYANETFKRLTGLSDEQVIGRNPRVLQTGDTDVESVARLRRAIDRGEEASVVLLNRRSDGRMWYNELDISPIRNDDCEVTHYLGFQRDVTDRVGRDQRLTVLDRVLRHNIRNRLNVVLGYADHIDQVVEAYSPTPDGEADTADVDAVRADVDHIRAAAVDVLELSDSARRFREDVVDIEDADPVDAAAVVEEVTARLAAASGDAEVRLSLPDRDVCVPGAAPLMLVVEELITNALEHAPEPTVTVSLSVDGDDAVLRVADDGPGITPDSRTPLAYGAETPTEHGQGIGLWLVRWSVDAVGGTVRYEETPGGGATVVARLPLVDRAPGDPTE